MATSIVAAMLFPNSLASAEEFDEGENSNVNIANYLESEDYIFTAERIPTNRWDTPANVHVITSEEIERNHYQSVDEALRHVNGVVVTEGLGIFHSESASGIGTHMVGGNRVLILIDGRRFFDPQSEKQEAKAFTGIPSIKMVDRIEIVKGGNSALYGSDAFSGVINIITKKGTRNETTIDLNTGTWNRHKYEITNQGVVDKFGWFITGKFDKGDYWDYKPNSSGYGHFAEVDDYDNHNFSIRLDQRFAERDSMTLDYAHVSGQWSLEGLAGSQKNKLNNMALSYNFKEGTNTPSWFRYVLNDYSKNATDVGKPHSRLQGLEYQNGWEIGRHKIIAGLEYHKNHAVDPIFDYDVKLTTKSIYFQDTISLGDKWKLIPGARYDHHNQFGGNWSPKIATNYRAEEKTKFYLTWGRSYNSPLSSELFSSGRWYAVDPFIDAITRIRKGSANLEPEKGYSFIGGFEHDFSEKSGMTLSFFQNKLNNYLDWNVDRFNVIDINTGERREQVEIWAQNHIPIKSRGIELTFRQNIDDHFSYNLGYSHTTSKFDSSNFPPMYRPQQNGYRLGLNYQNRGLKASLLGIMASGLNTNIGQRFLNTDAIYSYTTKKYAVWNLNISYDLNDRSTLYFKALNLTNQCYSDYTSENVQNRYVEYNKYVHHSPGRSFIFGVNYRF